MLELNFKDNINIWILSLVFANLIGMQFVDEHCCDHESLA